MNELTEELKLNHSQYVQGYIRYLKEFIIQIKRVEENIEGFKESSENKGLLGFVSKLFTNQNNNEQLLVCKQEIQEKQRVQMKGINIKEKQNKQLEKEKLNDYFLKIENKQQQVESLDLDEKKQNQKKDISKNTNSIQEITEPPLLEEVNQGIEQPKDKGLKRKNQLAKNRFVAFGIGKNK